MGAYAANSIKDPAKNYGAPFMTVGAQFDGWMARVTRIAESYDQMKHSDLDYSDAKYSYPVVMIPGISHASFLSGIPPSAVQNTDIRATVSNEEAVEQVSSAVSAFLTVTKYGKANATDAVKTLDHFIDDLTTPVMDPILDIWRYEGAPFLSSYNTSSPWVAEAQ